MNQSMFAKSMISTSQKAKFRNKDLETKITTKFTQAKLLISIENIEIFRYFHKLSGFYFSEGKIFKAVLDAKSV